MSRNSFGTLFRMTTFGESHGKGIGVVVDGCPAGIDLDIQMIQDALDQRRPGYSPLTSPRKESDTVELLSGVFEGQTTGTPIALFIKNENLHSQVYEPLKDLYRPGHANFTYLEKYGVFDYRGGGRASGRETAARVAAGAIASQLIAYAGVTVSASLYDRERVEKQILEARIHGDSIGGIVEVHCYHLPVGWGDPIYEKLEAKLAYAMLSIPASKGFEIGEGFLSSTMLGSVHNDPFICEETGKIKTSSNHAGGTLGGISTGMPLVFRVPFKPTSSVQRSQRTVTREGKTAVMSLPKGSRHDPCIAVRAVPVVAAMTKLVLADTMLLHRCSKIVVDIR